MPRDEDRPSHRGRSRSRSPIGHSRDDKYDDRRRTETRDNGPMRHGRRSTSRSRSRDGDRRRSRSRSYDRHKSRKKSRSPRRKSRSRSRDRSESRERSHRHGKRRSRSRSSERSRSRERDRKHRSRKRDRSHSSESDSDSDEEYRRKRKERRKEKESKRNKSKERRKEKKREKKEKKKHRDGGGAHWGKYGIISEVDIFSKASEFHTWLVEERKINPETISKDQNRKEFAKFVEDYNTATLPHEKYYSMEAYDRRMNALRSGELLPPTEDTYDPQADMKALKSAHKRRPAEQESYMSKEQLQELRRVQNERIEASKMKRLGMDIKQNMGVRMDGVGFD